MLQVGIYEQLITQLVSSRLDKNTFYVGERALEQAKDEHDRTIGFVNFGEVEYVAHTGNQPMNITWCLKQLSWQLIRLCFQFVGLAYAKFPAICLIL